MNTRNKQEDRKVFIWSYSDKDEDLPSYDCPDGAVCGALSEYVRHSDGDESVLDAALVPDEITIYGYARMVPRLNTNQLLDRELEYLDEDYGSIDGEATKPTPAMIAAAAAFAEVIEREYVSWACEVVEKRVINVRKWCAVHAPEWLAQLPAIKHERGDA